MPRVVEPLTRKVGPLGMKTSKGRRLNEKSKFENEHTQKFIGEELLEWHVENASAATLSKITARSHQPNAAQQTPTNSDTSKSTPLHAVSRVDQVHELAWQNFSSLSRHALALDTRFLKDPNEKKLQSDHATKCYEDFIRTLVLRGSTPCLVATTVATVPSQNSIVGLASLGIDVKTYCLGDSYTLQKVTDPNICVSHINIVAKETTGASSIPNTMTAEISWMLFGAFVDAILAKDATLGATSFTPLDITLLCTDVSLFCDSNAEAHKCAVKRFVEHVAPSFRKSLLDSIQVVMATTGELALRIDDKTQACSVPSKDVCASIHDKPVSPSIWVNNQEDSVAKCIEVIEATLDELEYTAFSQHGVTTGIEGSNPINVSFSVIDSSPIGYKYLSRQWIRDSLSMNQLSCRLNFDLPSAIDGTHCSVAFEAAYQIYPFAINSLQAKMLSSDLYYLSHLDFQVTQLVPLSSIDTSLLFGIPMKVRAGLENDYAHFQEMSVIVRTLFRLLQERELAILLRGTAKRTDESAYNSASRYGLFQSHSSSMEQMFVLMAQEVPSLAGHSPPSGLLCRIAHADQLLVEATKPTALGEAKYMASDQELEAQYTEYIEEALSRVDLGPFNPFDVASQQLTCSHRHGSNDCSSKVEALNATYDLLKVLSTCGSNHAYTPVECDPQSTSASGVFDDSAGIGSTIATENDYDVFIDGDILIFKDSQQWPSCVWNDRSSIGASDDRPTQETMAEDEETDVHTSSHDAEHY